MCVGSWMVVGFSFTTFASFVLLQLSIPVGLTSHGGDVMVCVLGINQLSLPTFLIILPPPSINMGGWGILDLLCLSGTRQ